MCDFVRINSSAEGPNDQHSIHFGYWSYESLDNSTNTTQNVCVLYPVDHFATDTTFKVGRTFNILALILGISFIFMDILNGCASTNPRKSFRQAGGVGYLLCSLCSGLSLLIFQVSRRRLLVRSFHLVKQYSFVFQTHFFPIKE